jgi:hypothetical protein
MKSTVFTERLYDLPYLPHERTAVYIDLRAHPTGINDLPELRDEPRLRPLASILNDPNGMFTTHACSVASVPPGMPGSTNIDIPYGAKHAPCWYTSYIVFSFWHLSQNKTEHYEAIYRSYPSDKNKSNVCFEIGPAYFCTPFEQRSGVKQAGDTNGAICTIWVSGWGSTALEAQDRWSSGIDDLITFFAKFISAPTGITLSEHMFGATKPLPTTMLP